MSYYINLKDISIDKYKEVLKSAILIPSWKILRENIEQNLNQIKKQNIQNVDELKVALKDKGRVEELSKKTSLSNDYLNVLRRVVNGYHPKPNRIKDFPNVPNKVAEKLQKLGLTNTLKLYDHILTPPKRAKLSLEAGIAEVEILKLARLTDLSRIRWVNHTFAYVLLEAGYDTAEKVAKADYQEMYETIKKLNEERGLYKANIGANDMKMCIEAARGLDLDVNY